MVKQFETLDEVEIVQLAKDGDEKAFEFIVKKYQNKVANLIFKIIDGDSLKMASSILTEDRLEINSMPNKSIKIKIKTTASSFEKPII